MPQSIFVGRIAPHYWEEPVISGKKGTAAVFFTGCTLDCIYCQNREISHFNQGREMTVSEICSKISELLQQGCETVSFITPTHYINKVKEIIDILKPEVPIVYNTSGYETVEGIKSLKGYIDIYLPDLKYSSNALGKKYSNADNYFDVASRAIEEMVFQTGAPICNNENILQKGTIVRNLVLPNHTRNSIEVIEFLSKKYGDTILFSLMGQYVPYHKAVNHPKLNRKITKREYQKVLNAFECSNLTGFCQELSSADESYIPQWAT